MPPHLCSWIRGGIIPIPLDGITHPFPIGFRFALVPPIAVGGFVVARILPITMRIVRTMEMESPVSGVAVRGSLVFGERRWLIAVPFGYVVLVTKLGGKIVGVCGRLSLQGAVNCELVGLVEGTGLRVSRAERE